MLNAEFNSTNSVNGLDQILVQGSVDGHRLGKNIGKVERTPVFGVQNTSVSA